VCNLRSREVLLSAAKVSDSVIAITHQIEGSTCDSRMMESMPSTGIHLRGPADISPVTNRPIPFFFIFDNPVLKVFNEGAVTMQTSSLFHVATTLLENKCCLISGVLRCLNNFNECPLVIPELFRFKRSSDTVLADQLSFCRLQSDHFCFSLLLRSTISASRCRSNIGLHSDQIFVHLA